MKTKTATPAPARQLYCSPLFDRRRRYAEQRGLSWYVLSAEHGLVAPDTLLEPYDVDLSEQTNQYRGAWAQWVVAKLRQIDGDLAGRRVEIHAGDAYATTLVPLLSAAGADVRRPLARLSMGRQLAWYDDVNKPDAAAPFAELTILDGPHSLPPFSHRWPDGPEEFDGGAALVVQNGVSRHHIRIGTGVRAAYGRDRRRMVVWVDGRPVAGGFGTDDHAHTRRLASTVKDADGRPLGPADPLPVHYLGFPLVRLADVVTGPGPRDAMAVHLPEADTAAWAAYAVARLRTSQSDVPATARRRTPGPTSRGRRRWWGNSWRTGAGTPKNRRESPSGTRPTRLPTRWCSETRSPSFSRSSSTRESPPSGPGGHRTICGNGWDISTRRRSPPTRARSPMRWRGLRRCTGT
ncbi:DUF6884 domain-containing protein [Amorphoplanes digitatis]|uniref:DUF6884 domain-containing protein n=1 Tax=Actinoplanes digitatis TaxID=1868 RepID=A0A7W7HX69_9ACTN|nr:DUF6884 domain-containing protein [Actinoplanes digitatis]MBB4762389.1 hypothetical protein [Actinoplanes digitatis]